MSGPVNSSVWSMIFGTCSSSGHWYCYCTNKFHVLNVETVNKNLPLFLEKTFSPVSKILYFVNLSKVLRLAKKIHI